VRKSDKIKILVISSVVPNAKDIGGELVLHRYLHEDPDIEVEVFRWAKFPLRLKIIGKMKKLGFYKSGNILECLWPVYPKAKEIDKVMASFKPDIILTVAHAWFHLAAAKASLRRQIPLITFFQDWWADFDREIPQYCNKRMEQFMRRTCEHSTKVIGVSKGMLRELGNPINAQLIHDLPAVLPLDDCAIDKKRPEGPFRLVYFGNLGEYGPMIESLLDLCQGRADIELHVFGPKPKWSCGAEERFRKLGLFHGLLPRDEFTSRIAEFDGILAAMQFDEGLGRRMMTSFPSKIIEGVQYGLPIIVWGPDHCSAVEWARMKNRALCVTDPSAEALIAAISKHKDAKGDIDLRQYSLGSRLAAEEEFNPLNIRKQFKQVLCDVLAKVKNEIVTENNYN